MVGYGFLHPQIRVVAIFIQEKVDMLNQKKSPIQDKELQEYLQTKELDLTATTDDLEEVCSKEDDAELFVPTFRNNYA